MNENTEAASGTVCMNVTGEYSRRQYDVDWGRCVIYEYLITVSLEGGYFAVLVLARNGIVGLVIPLRPAGVMTRFRRACESCRSARERAAYVKDPNGPEISLLAMYVPDSPDISSDLNVDAMSPDCPTNIHTLPSRTSPGIVWRSGDVTRGAFYAYK